MLYRHEDYQESYVHVCDDAHKYQRKYIAARPRIVVHDCSGRMTVDNKVVHIDFCPFCGKQLDSDERTNEFYKF